MVSHEGIESSELHPSRAKLFRRVAGKAADVGSGHGDAVQVEVEDFGDGNLKELPRGEIIARPMGGELSGPDVGASRKNEGLLASDGEEGFVGGDGLEEPVEVVDIVLLVASVMEDIHGNGLVLQGKASGEVGEVDGGVDIGEVVVGGHVFTFLLEGFLESFGELFLPLGQFSLDGVVVDIEVGVLGVLVEGVRGGR